MSAPIGEGTEEEEAKRLSVGTPSKSPGRCAQVLLLAPESTADCLLPHSVKQILEAAWLLTGGADTEFRPYIMP
ncbi:MAG: hypothetical protein ABR555_08260 [Pyrinomonadaceae bacterium]